MLVSNSIFKKSARYICRTISKIYNQIVETFENKIKCKCMLLPGVVKQKNAYCTHFSNFLSTSPKLCLQGNVCSEIYFSLIDISNEVLIYC
jgi:hypothetical protein